MQNKGSKLWSEMNRTKVYSKILLIKTKQFYLFICILPDYVGHESHKECWKNSPEIEGNFSR